MGSIEKLISARAPPDLSAWLKQRAAKESRSAASMVRLILEAERERERGKAALKRPAFEDQDLV